MRYITNDWQNNYSIRERQKILLSRIIVIDDFLPNYNLDFFLKQFKFEGLNTNYKLNLKIGRDVSSTEKMYQDFIDVLVNQINLKLQEYNTNIKKILRKVLLISDLESQFHNHRHVDDSYHLEKGYTLSYHWMGDENAGGTAFFPDFSENTPLIQIPFKPNRLVIFPSCIPHEGYANPHKKYNSKRIIFALFTELT